MKRMQDILRSLLKLHKLRKEAALRKGEDEHQLPSSFHFTDPFRKNVHACISIYKEREREKPKMDVNLCVGLDARYCHREEM